MSDGFEGATDLLEAFAGFKLPGEESSADRPVRLGVVSAGYAGGLVPIRFEGEPLAGAKRYAAISGYQPQPGDRVALLPVGSTWLILGVVDSDPTRFPQWAPITASMYKSGWKKFVANDFQADPEFIRLPDGLVKLKGLVAGGDTTNGAVVLNLPEGLRPTGRLHFPTVSSTDGNATTGDRSAMLRVWPNGDVTAGFGVAGFWLSLDSITFVPER